MLTTPALPTETTTTTPPPPTTIAHAATAAAPDATTRVATGAATKPVKDAEEHAETGPGSLAAPRKPGTPSDMVRIAFAALGLSFTLASTAHAQVIQRDRDTKPAASDAKKADASSKDASGAKKDAGKSEDDDILAPKNGGAKPDQPSPDANKPKQFTVGLVGIVPVGDAGKPLADKVTTGLLKELGAGHVFDAQPLAVSIAGASAGAGVDENAAKSALADGKAAFDKAQKALDALKLGVAKKLFAQALDSYEKAAPVLTGPDELISCRLGLAEVAAREGQDDESANQLAAAAALNPERQLDKKKYPGAFITTFLKQRDRILKDKRGSVVVDATGAGSTVEIDGRTIQGAPATVTDVPEGRHLVRAVREGLPAYGTVVDVKPGESASVSPGFIAKDGHSYLDDLQNNRFSADAAKAVGDAAKAAGEKGGVVGVVSKSETGANVQLVLVDANGAGMIKLPLLAFTGDMLDIGIETLKARDAIEAALSADSTTKPAWSKDAVASLIDGAKAGTGAQMATVALRYDVQPLKAPTRSRVVSDDANKHDDDDSAGDTVASTDDGGDEHKVLSAGSSGRRQRIEDETDPYAGNKSSGGSQVADPDAPLTDQPWFWPAAIGGGAAVAVVVIAGAVVGLVAAKVVPDPRPTSGGVVTVTP